MSAANMAYASCSTYDALSSGSCGPGASCSGADAGAEVDAPQRCPLGSLAIASLARCENTNDASSCMPCRYPRRGFSSDHTRRTFSSAC